MYSASRAATAAYRPMLDELGLTYPQYLVMLVLWEDAAAQRPRAGGGAGARLRHALPAAQAARSPGPGGAAASAADERRVEIFLTDAGTALSARAAGIPQRLADAAGLSGAELDQLRETLGRLAAALHPPTTFPTAQARKSRALRRSQRNGTP